MTARTNRTGRRRGLLVVAVKKLGDASTLFRRVECGGGSVLEANGPCIERELEGLHIPAVANPRAQPQVITVGHELPWHLRIDWRNRLKSSEEASVSYRPGREDADHPHRKHHDINESVRNNSRWPFVLDFARAAASPRVQ